MGLKAAAWLIRLTTATGMRLIQSGLETPATTVGGPRGNEPQPLECRILAGGAATTVDQSCAVIPNVLFHGFG